MKSLIGIICLILAVGCIDGPAGYENDNWAGMFMFAIAGIIFGVLGIKDQNN